MPGKCCQLESQFQWRGTIEATTAYGTVVMLMPYLQQHLVTCLCVTAMLCCTQD